ncbi:hypothetical protein [Spiroplasma endosymbiont of Phyllotreta cruciferae]|uniref:hypothetical protein n=1 Tax=Spiroplasma endosymbiont of Phyllotreta cruciferae TaxID=2886375 RepID=UPI00209F8FE3|nr:hypothetical protein [Spiroplasma endosymbiont of Phyllotreta cruciferae]
MAQNPQRIFGDITNQATQRDEKHLNNDIYKLINKNLVEKHYLREKKPISFV